MTQQYFIKLPSYPRGYHLITSDISAALKESLPEAGVLHIHIMHTSAGLTINENADPDVRHDCELYFNKIVPENLPGMRHTIEGPDDMPAHIKASLVGNSISLPIVKGKLGLGTWQGIYLCEFRNHASSRRLLVTVIS